MPAKRKYNHTYRGQNLDRVAFPLGGIGAGMICLEGTGAFSHVSLRNKPEVYHEPMIFAALHARPAAQTHHAGVARVLEGPAPMWKAFGPPGTGNGASGKTYGLPRFAKAAFSTRFPFARVELEDVAMPVLVELTGWSPFAPGARDSADDASLPVAGLEYRFHNRAKKAQRLTFSFHAANFMQAGTETGANVQPMVGGFALVQPAVADKPWERGGFAAFVNDPEARVDCGWWRGGWFDTLTIIWQHIAAGRSPANPPHAEGKPGTGGSLYVPFTLRPGEERTIRLHLAWYVPETNIRLGAEADPVSASPAAATATGAPAGCATDCACHDAPAPARTYQPWYAGRFASLDDVAAHWRGHYDRLHGDSREFADGFYDTTLPPEVVEAVAANLTILKSPTCLRQADGRLWAWEGCGDSGGCCAGSCTHVWNYAQAPAHLFPELERSLRDTEYLVDQDEQGHQNFRASLPIRQPDHKFHAAADGQLGGIIKLYRDWRISGDTAWMSSLWPNARRSLGYAIATWDPDHTGTLVEPHHNTYDIEFWGADGLCTSFYLSALAAAIAMGRRCGSDVTLYEKLLAAGRKAMEKKLYNGDYFYQRVRWKDLRAGDPTAGSAWNVSYSEEARAVLAKEGPKYQYGTGCLSDGVLGDWMARVSGLPPVLDEAKVRRHLDSVFRHNFKPDLSGHANPQRPAYAMGAEGGLLVCSWPRGGKLSMPFPYSDEVWTGMEYDVAAHLIMLGRVQEGLRIVRAARDRYDGRYRNPFNEYECGHWYARAMSSYSLLQALSGARYDAVEKTLYLHPGVKGDFRSFLATAGGYATVGVKRGQPFCEVRRGAIEVERIDYQKA